MMMAGTAGVRVMVSCASVGLESREEAGAQLFSSRCSSEKRSLAGGWDDFRWRGRLRVVMMARRAGARSAGASRPSTSRGPPKQQQQQRESSRNSSPISRKTTQKEIKREDDGGDEMEFDEDALEALFAQLEVDLEAGGVSEDEDLSEEEVIELENELAAALRDIEEEEEVLRTIDVVAGDAEMSSKDDNLTGDSNSSRRNMGKSGGQTSIEVKDQFADAILKEFEDEPDEQRVVALEPWQLRKLAAAVKMGRRKVNIKALSAEVGMDRFDVLSWLKDPPPELLMYSATMEDEESAHKLPEDGASSSSSAILNAAEKQDGGPDPEVGLTWHSRKRLRKEHEATFERVFRNTDRPSNAILQNLVELTHVPRKRIVEWFEKRRKVKRVSPKFEALR